MAEICIAVPVSAVPPVKIEFRSWGGPKLRMEIIGAPMAYTYPKDLFAGIAGASEYQLSQIVIDLLAIMTADELAELRPRLTSLLHPGPKGN